MATKQPQCLSNSANTCMDADTVSVAVKGWYCSNDICLKCPIGTFGIDGKTCTPCPFAQWQPELGQTSCTNTFTYTTPGLIKSYIPYGVDKIIVKVWGGGGGSDNTLDTNYVTHSGGSGGYSACNMTVTNSQPVYVIVAGGGGANALTTNSGGFGGGGRGFVVTGYGPGGGGGRSAIQRTLGVDAITAGGGGGGADCLKKTGCGGGGGGGTSGKSPSDPASGRGGSASAGGSAGIGFYCTGTAGSLSKGGDGCRSGQTAVSSGGGGGYYGGGGGSGFGNGNATTNPPVFDVGGGGGGGSSYGGGCDIGTYINVAGFTGNGFNGTQSGGLGKRGYQAGVGIGGKPGGVKGGDGLVVITFVPNFALLPFSVRPTGQPSGAPTGQPSMQPSSKPSVSPSLGISKRPTGQPTSYPSRFQPFPIVAGAATVGGLSTQSAIIIFSAVGAVVLCIFVCFSCYFQHKFINKEEDRIHSLVEENFDDDDIILDDGEGGDIVDNESMYYRQFGEVETPMHTFKDKDGNLVPGTARVGGGSFATTNNGSMTGRSRQSFVLRKSFAGSQTARENGSFSMNNTRKSMGENNFRNPSFGVTGRRQKVVNRTSISTLGTHMNGDEESVNGDMTSRSGNMTGRSGRLTGRSMTGRSQTQVLSQVRVKSFSGNGPAPRLIKMLASAGNTEDIARARYIAAHEDDVLGMQNFFRRAGLSMKKSIVCAEESICLDANSPRKLFKYVHEVSGFSLMNLGMDKIDADMVLEVLNSEFSHKDISAAGAAAAAVAKMMGGTAGGQFGDQSDVDDRNMNHNDITTASMIQKKRPEDSSKARHIAEHEDDVLDMQEFFRFAGLSIQLSRECAEEAICMDANSPKKLYKYLEDVKGFQLTDLGMDAVDADMVFETLKREFASGADGARGKGRTRINIDDDNDYKSDSSEGYDDKTHSECDWTSLKTKAKKNWDTYDESVSPTYNAGSKQPAGPASIVMKHSASSVTRENQKLYQVPFLKAQSKAPEDGHDAFAAEVHAAMENQQQGNMTGRSTESVSTLGMKEADNYYQVNQTSLHSLGVAVALNMLPPRPSSGIPGERPDFRSNDRDSSADEKQNDMKDFLSQVAVASSGPPVKSKSEQTYEESMGTGAMGLNAKPADCYFTHDWSLDELKRSNQEQMLLIDEELRNRGMLTACDKNRQPVTLTDAKKAAMFKGIDDSESVLVFVTQKFMGKVNGMDGANDICKVEFDYALKSCSSKIILVVLEERMKNVSTWKGQLRKCIGDTTTIIDMVEQEDEDIFNTHMELLINAVTAAKKSPRKK